MVDPSKLEIPFEFVVVAGARAGQLLAGCTPKRSPGQHKKTTMAHQEVLTRSMEKVPTDSVAVGE